MSLLILQQRRSEAENRNRITALTKLFDFVCVVFLIRGIYILKYAKENRSF